MSDGLTLRGAVENGRAKPGDSEEVTQLKGRIRLLETTISRLELDLFRVLAGELREPSLRGMALMTIAEMVEARTGISINDLRSRRRDRMTSYARHLFWYLSKKNTTKSLPVLGKFLEKDHTSVIHGIKRIKARMETEPLLVDLIVEMSKDIRGIQEA